MDEQQKTKVTLFERARNHLLDAYKSMVVQHYLYRIRRMTIRQIIDNPMARMIFSEYLVLKNVTLEADILLNWKCYELCRKIRENPSLINVGKVFENLIHCSPSNIWENDLWTMICRYDRYKDENELQTFLKKLENECIRNMQNHSNYHKFAIDLHFKSWRIEQLLLDVYNDRKFKYYAPHFLDLETDPCLTV